MKLQTSLARAAAFILTGIPLHPAVTWAQADMKDMPGMTPKATSAPKPAAPATAPKPAAGGMTQAEMDAMPGMSPSPAVPGKPASSAPAAGDMSGMPGMDHGNAAKSKGMAAMPGMKRGKMPAMSGMSAMPGMAAGDESAPARMSAPGVTILRPPQKWVPPRGDNRAAELLSLPALEAFMRPLPPPIEDSMLHGLALFDLLEYRANSEGPNSLVWDFIGWFGGDYQRLWMKSEGSLDLSAGHRGTGDVQLLYGRLLAPFWDLQFGVRAKQNLGSGFDNNSRTYAVLGLQGLSPGNFEVEPAIYISDRGEVSAELTLSADLYLTQRLILQPRFQGEASLQGDDRFGTGEGVTETDLGLRLRYEIAREFAPYIGVSWLRSYGETARLARQAGEPTDTVAFVAGLRLWW